VRNFRRIEQLDVEFTPETRVICFVGPNGSGKSSLLSILADSLCGLTKESAPDLVKKGVGQSPDCDPWTRTLGTFEIGQGADTAFVLTDWQASGTSATHGLLLRRLGLTGPAKNFLPEEFKNRMPLGFGPNNPFLSQWNQLAYERDDPVAKSVLLIRPAERWEEPSYEESPELSVSPFLAGNWVGRRPFPVRVRTWGIRLEQFLLQMFIEQSARPSGYGVKALESWASVFEKLTGESFTFTIGTWPYARVGPPKHPQMSLLSSGELDVLVTAAAIVAQGMAVAIKHGYDESSFVPRGFVFIDEVDAHLHPQWQQKVMPILTEAFPQITFVITTHSPFVLRSLNKETSRVIRLPDGEVFDTEFAAWQIDDILEAVFEVPAQWAPGIGKQLAQFKKLVPDAGRVIEAQALYQELLAHDSAALQAECQHIAGLFGSREFMEAVAKQELLDRQPVGAAASANGDAHNANGG
jgi:energy-coupling factor transporter ATP-binding protein EcfA2